jgi:hypothetical protein
MSAKSFLKRPFFVLSLVVLVIAIVAAAKFGPVTEAGSKPALLTTVTATNVDALVPGATTDVDGDGRADQGDTLEYTVTITNTGAENVTGMIFSDTLSGDLTLVGGSVDASPAAANDGTFQVMGNVRIQVPDGANDLLNNDVNPTTGTNAGLTASGSGTSAQGGNFSVNADGSFSYNPAPGFTGTDSFTYTVTNATGSTTATVNLSVSGMVWFVNASAAAGGDGRLTTPFNSIASFNATAADDPGDVIFIYTGTYTGGIALLNTQKLIGQGFNLQTETGAAPAHSDALPAVGASPTIDNAGVNIISLGQNNTLRGFNTGNSGAAGTDISGTSFGTLTISDLSIGGDGRALNLTTGTLAAAVSSIAASNTGTNTGLTLNGVGGALTVSGSTTITNPGGAGIDITNAPAGASFSFGTTSVSKNAAGACLNLATNNAGATTAFTSLAVTNSSGAGITTNGGGTFNVTTGSITTTGTGVAASLTNTALGLTFTSVSSNGGANGFIISGGSGSFTSGTTNLQNNAGIGLLVSSSSVVAGFGNTTVNSSAGDAVDLSSNTGSITFADLDMTPDAGLRGLDAQNNTGTITATSGDITTSGGGTASAVFIDGPAGRTPINLTFNSVTTSGVGSGSASVSIVDASGTKFQVTGTTQINTRSGRGVFVDNATTTTVQFATVNIPNPSNAGGNAFHIEDSSSAVTVATVAISDPFITSAQSDPGNDSFPDTDGDGDGIFLRGNSGLFTLNGGTISSPGNDGIDARTTRIAITGVTITNPGQDVTGATGEGYGGHGIFVMNPATGTSTIATSTISGFNVANRSGLVVNSNTGTATLTVTGSTFQNSTGNTGATSLVNSTGNLTLTFGGATNNVSTNCTFSNISASAIVPRSAGNGVLNFTVQNSTFQNAPLNGKTNVTGGATETSVGNFTIINNTFTSVFKTASTGEALISFVSGHTGGTNNFGINVSGNTISGVGLGNNTCTGGDYGGGPLEAILVLFDGDTDANGTININNNVISDVQQGGILLDMANDVGGNVDAKITGNTVGTDANPVGRGPSASVTTQFGIEVFRRRVGAETANVLISNNSIRNGNGTPTTLNAGIFVRGEADTSLSTTITNNNVNTLSTGPVEIRVDANSPGVGDPDAAVVCADITGNTVAAGAGGIDLNEATGNTLNIEQASAAAVAAANGIPAGNVTPDAGVAFGVTCATPPAIAEETASVSNNNFSDYDGFLQQPVQTPSEMVAMIEPFVKHSITAKTISNELIAASGEIAAELISSDRAEASIENAGYLETVAAIFGETFDKLSSAMMPTVTAQEKDNISPQSNELVCIDGDADVDVGTCAGPGFTLPAGKSVTVKFRATINNPPPVLTQVTNQGTVSGSNFASPVLTDDPDIAGSANPTVTLIDSTTVVVSSSQNPSITGQSVTFTATLTGAPVHATGDPAGTVQFFDNGVALGAPASVSAGALNDNTGTATITVSDLTAGSHPITATYSGGGGFNANNTSNTVNQTVSNTAVWDGSTSTAWADGTNWTTNGAPSLATNDVSIPAAGVTNNPTISAADVTVNNLTLSAGRTLTVNTSRTLNVNGTLTLSGNNILGGSAGTIAIASAGSVVRTSGAIETNLRKTYSATGNQTFEVGTTNGYSPASINVTAGTFPLDFTLRAVQGGHPNIVTANKLQRYWTVTPSGGAPTASMTFNYFQTDVVGTEGGYRVVRVTGGTPTVLPNAPSVVIDTTNNTFSINGISTFSDWTMAELAPTAASVNVGGRVIDVQGMAVPNAQVTMVDSDGNVRLSRTNPFGYYRYFDVPVGSAYIINVAHKLHQFTPQFIFATEDRENLDFVALP